MIEPTTKIGIATVQWNHVNHTINLLDDLLENDNLAIAICDNGSNEECWNQLKHKLNNTFIKANSTNKTTTNNWRIALIRNAHNSGFATGMNSCVNLLIGADCEWFWLINNDVRIKQQQLNNLIRTLKSTPAGVYGTVIVNENGRETPGINTYNKWTTHYKPLDSCKHIPNLLTGLFYPNGASMVIHRSVFEDVGLLSEETFLYFEELEYTNRLIKSTDFKLGILEDVSIQHVGAGSSDNTYFKNKRMYHQTWSLLSYYKRVHPLTYYLMLLVRTPLRFVILAVKGRWNELIPLMRATIDFTRGFNRDKRSLNITNKIFYS